MKRMICFMLAFCCLFSCAMAEERTVEQELNAAFRKYDTLGACIAVIQNGEITYTYAYGDARIGGAKVTEDTLFQVGSISKMIGNMGLMQLLSERGIPLDAEIGDVLGYPVRHPLHPDTPVTLRQLMTHTAALRDGGDYKLALSGQPKTLRELFEKRGEYTFYEGYVPGMQRMYSNFGGGLIGSLIEAISGMTLDQYMQQNIFEPLGITAAYQVSQLPQDAKLADLYHMPKRWIAKSLRDDKSNVTEPDGETHYTFTAGKLIISAPDLAKLLIALCDGGVYGNKRILSESAVAHMLTPQNGIGSVSCDTQNGLFLNIIVDNQVQGRTMYGHGGKANGMLCAAYFDPTDRTGVVMLTNGCQNESMHNGVGMLGRVVMRICYDRIIDPTHQAEDAFSVGD